MLHIFTLTWQGKDKISKLMPTLLSNLNGIDYTWWIKDNGSSDGTIDLINQWNNPNIKIIATGHNRDTFSLGINKCFNEASPKDDDFILLLNNDIIFNDSKSLKKMINLWKEGTGAVGAKLTYLDKQTIQHAGIVFDHRYIPKNYRAGKMHQSFDLLNREFQAVTGAVMLTKANIYKNICNTNKSGLPGFSEEFIWCFDDVDACLSIKYNQNKKIIFCGETDISHEESATLKKNPVQKMFLDHNLKAFFNKWKSTCKVDESGYTNNSNYKLI